METRKLFAVVGLVALFVTPVMAAPSGDGAGYDGGWVSITRTSGYYGGFGGEFTIYNYEAKLGVDLTKYADTTKNVYTAPSFQTFCVETTEYYVSPADVWVSEAFIDGSQPGSHSYLSSTTSGMDLNPYTAYLYTEFAKGTLAGYDYSVGAGRQASAAALQEAIWYLQSQPAYLAHPYDPANLSSAAEEFVALAVDAGWTTIGNVRVMQMYNAASLKQDMLVIVPTPGAILLAGIGTTLVGVLRRRKAM